MKIDLAQIRFIDPLEVGVCSDGVKLYVLGYSDQFEGQPIAATEPHPDPSH